MDYYSILGINNSATDNDIRKAYLKLAKKYHPDKCGSNEMFIQIKEAYNKLKNKEEEINYDMELHQNEFLNSVMNMLDGMELETFFGNVCVKEGELQFKTKINKIQEKKYIVKVSIKDLYNGKDKTLKIKEGTLKINMRDKNQIHYINNTKILIELKIKKNDEYYIEEGKLMCNRELLYTNLLKNFNEEIILPNKEKITVLCNGKDIVINNMIKEVKNKGINGGDLVIKYKLKIDMP